LIYINFFLLFFSTFFFKNYYLIYSRNRVGTEVYVFQCISMLATAVGQALTKHMHELLDIMLAQGLSEALTQALSDLSNYIPPLLPTIQDRLLNVLSIILSGQPYHHPSSSYTKQTNLIQSQMRDLQVLKYYIYFLYSIFINEFVITFYFYTNYIYK